MGALRLRTLLALGLFLTALVWGTRVCLFHFNRFLVPPEPIRAVEWRRLDDEHLACEFLGVDLLLAVPRGFPAWSALPGPPNSGSE